MSIDKVDLRNRMVRVRQAFFRAESYPVDVLVNKYKLPLSLLLSLCEVELLTSQENTIFRRSAAWAKEPNMSLTKLINIVIGKTKLQVDTPPPDPGPILPEAVKPPDVSVDTPSLEDLIKLRQSLVMTFRLVKAKRLQAELSWYSIQPFGAVKFNHPDVRYQHYEQEAFEIGDRFYRVVDLETHMLKALKQFFEGVTVEITVKRIHHK